MDEEFGHFFQDGGKEFEKYLEGPLNPLILVPSNLKNWEMDNIFFNEFLCTLVYLNKLLSLVLLYIVHLY